MTEQTKGKNLIQKIQAVQRGVRSLVRDEENKFHSFYFFDEFQVLKLLKPLLDENELTILVSDVPSGGFECQKEGSMWLVKYWKQLEILTTKEDGSEESKIIPYFCTATNNDPAKAKGSAETYALKYTLAKLFLIPAKDRNDPDYAYDYISKDLQKELYDLFVEVRGKDDRKQESLINEFDKMLTKYGIKDKTNKKNFWQRLELLTKTDYDNYKKYLEQQKKLN
jgi:hypothetical protein